MATVPRLLLSQKSILKQIIYTQTKFLIYMPLYATLSILVVGKEKNVL